LDLLYRVGGKEVVKVSGPLGKLRDGLLDDFLTVGARARLLIPWVDLEFCERLTADVTVQENEPASKAEPKAF
jgi:hypothetical protein